MMLAEEMRPTFERDAALMIAEASAAGAAIEIIGGGSKRGIGRPVAASHRLNLRNMKGITLYEPSEMVMSVRAGTLVSEVAETLARSRQMLAFEPSEFSGIGGGTAAASTMGAVFAMNAAGPRRITAGAARDHLIGIRAVSGLGEVFKSGGRVMKNVTGYDLPKTLAGSWGTLAVMTEVTFKVAPIPDQTSTLVLLGLQDPVAIEVLCAALGTPYEVSGAVHLQAALATSLEHPGIRSQAKAVTAIRIENSATFVMHRRDRLAELLRPYGQVHDLDHENSRAFWDELRRLSFFAKDNTQVWRISTLPTKGATVVDAVRRYMDCRAFFDWSGGLIWLETPATADAGAADIRRVVATHGGHATLFRADQSVRAAVDCFQPQSPAVLKLARQLKSAFDPAGILNPGRMTSHF